MINFFEAKARGFSKNLESKKISLRRWSHENFLGILSLTVLLMTLVLLRSAGYFDPYLTLSINLIVIIMLITARVFLKINHQQILVISLLFMGMAVLLKIFVVNIWAERSMIYSFESLLFGVSLILYENSSWKLLSGFGLHVIRLVYKLVLKISSRHVIIIALSFMFLAILLKLFSVNFWSERLMIYSLGVLFAGVALMLVENRVNR